MEWQPIESPPKHDGEFNVCADTDDGPYVTSMEYNAAKNHWIHAGEPTFCHSWMCTPTHWQPLPAPPTV